MIDPLNKEHRARLSDSIAHWYNEHARYRHARRETIIMHAGSTEWASTLNMPTDKRVLGNLMQLSAQAHATTLAYGLPQCKVVSETPAADPTAEPLQEFLNKWVRLINLKAVARDCALDSFFGYGIAKVAEGMLPMGAQHVAKQPVGPMVWRISQDNFLFDGDAMSWDYMSWMADMYTVPLAAVKKHQPFLDYNPERTLNLNENMQDRMQDEGRLHNTNNQQSACPMVRLIDVWLPATAEIATWPVDSTRLTGISGEPLEVRKWNGHPAGPYSILSHLDVPDNMIPVAECESTKALHILFNELADRTAHQATEAKVNPIYETGSQRDMQRLEAAQDRAAVPVANINKIGMWEKPGPTQSQTAYMNASLQMFKEFAGNLDDMLGLGQTAGTASQSKLIRQATSARGADKRRRMAEFMESIFTKLAHLALNDQTLTVPNRKKIGNSDIMIDTTWRPPSQAPRDTVVDSYAITLVPYSLEYREPAERLAQLNEASMQIFQAMQLTAQGAPLDLAQYVETQADYRDLPELRNWYTGLLPDVQQAKAQTREASMQRPGVGEYIRENVSTQTNDGGLTQNLEQAVANNGPDNGGVTRVA